MADSNEEERLSNDGGDSIKPADNFVSVQEEQVADTAEPEKGNAVSAEVKDDAQSVEEIKEASPAASESSAEEQAEEQVEKGDDVASGNAPLEKSTDAEGDAASDVAPPEMSANAEADVASDSAPLEKSAKAESPATNDESIANSVGAQILMNRFSTWKQAANQRTQTLMKQAPVIQKNAAALWKQAPNIAVPAMQRVRSTGSKETKPGSERDEGATVQKDDSIQVGQLSIDTDERVHENKASLVDSSIASDKKIENSVDNTEDIGGTDELDEKSTRAGVPLGTSRASVAAESVATGFRGRYSNSNASAPPQEVEEPVRTPSPESQTALILKSRAGEHMQDILDNLEKHEYVMLLGRGMLGVNLKQCFLKNHGVFIDYLVQGGQAESSGVIRSGDLPMRIGDVDLRKGTILDIPRDIARARRPVVLMFASGTKVALERMNYIDVIVAMMHRARDFYKKRETLSNLPSASPERPRKSDEAHSEEGKAGEEPSGIGSVSDVEIPIDDSVDSFVTPPAPNLAVRKEFVEEVTLRCYDKFIVSELCQVADMDENFRAALRNAFLTCTIDSRRLHFLSRHFSAEEELPEGSYEGEMAPSAQLMLFLELMTFLDLYSVTPVSRLRDITSRIAFKFFLPTKIGNTLQPPLFDFHHIVADSSLRHLEFVLSGKSQSIPRDTFLDFQKAVVDSLMGAPFISFLTSSECARMRAFLRNTAPFVNLPLRDLFDALVKEDKHTNAKNCFAYILLFLICQLEKEPTGENTWGKEDGKKRLLGASNDICCALFIRRNLVPTLNEAKAKLEGSKNADSLDGSVAEKVVSVCEKFWDIFISGTLEISSKSNEIEASFMEVKAVLETAAANLSNNNVAERSKSSLEAILKSDLVEKVGILADELLYNYAANVHTKFREHKSHEWMCNELSKVRAGDTNWTNKQEIPVLQHGCIKRLLRKANLPEGVSSHKPFKSSAADLDSQRSYPNADYAVIFGSTVGKDIASQMPSPGIEESDIRRYACFPVALDKEDGFESFQAEEVIPPTFESYAVAPKMTRKAFSQLADETRLSVDGWEVSLVSFAIPNAESADPLESALHGVSLFFQRNSDCKEAQGDIPTDIVYQAPDDSSKPNQSEEKLDASPTPNEHTVEGFKSPICFADTEGSSSEAPTNMIRKVSVSSEIPKFKRELSDTPWTQRAQTDEYRDDTKPLAIGLALVSRRNVILAMRHTLSTLLSDYARQPGEKSRHSALPFSCTSLVNLLGTFTCQDVETSSLQCILEPYLRGASSFWIERPIAKQEEAFESLALTQISDCLPPIPLALLFVTLLLEQKVVISSSRRSVLFASSVALKSLLKPLKWSHLLVPMVPASLAGDLIQYPAPFVLGITSEETGNVELMGNLPKDVTLVDLDVGRVILAPSFGHDNEMVQRSPDSDATARALRSQVLYLAQALGSVFGQCLKPQTWCCDSPYLEVPSHRIVRLQSLQTSAQSFIHELLEGVTSCCYWIEEEVQSYGTVTEPTVLFDEDKFFEIKNHRATKAFRQLFTEKKPGDLALSLDDFDLVLESFLRCQSMSSYISSQPKTEMVYY